MQTTLRTAIAWSFGKKNKEPEFIKEATKMDVPGPGNYDEETFKKVKSQPKIFSFGKDPKMKKIRSTTPGPGHYSRPDEDFFGKEGPKFSIGKNDKPRDLYLNTSLGSGSVGGLLGSKLDHTPGPGQYSVDMSVLEKTRKKSPTFKMGKSKKEVSYKNDIPGPGEYNPDPSNVKQKTPGYSISKSQRTDHLTSDNRDAKIVPGPGNYNVYSSLGNGPKVSIRGKNNFNPVNRTPGPGAYDHNKSAVLQKTPGYKLGTSKKDDHIFLSKSVMSTPGPGMYNGKSDFDITAKKSGFKFGKDPKSKKTKSGTPGPGYYYIPCTMVNVPGYTTGKFDKTFKWV